MLVLVEDVPIAKLRAHPANYQRHPPDQLDEIARSIDEHGFFRNIVAARDFTILAGHGVVEAARRRGNETVPVHVLDIEPDSAQARRVIVADNEISRMAEVDDRALTELLRGLLDEAETGLDGTGFSPEQLAALALITRTADELPDFNAAAEWVGMPEFDPIDPRPRLVIQFETAAERQRFMTEYNFTAVYSGENRQAWSMRWPQQPRRDLDSIEYR